MVHGKESVNDSNDVAYKKFAGQSSGSLEFSVPARPVPTKR